MAAKIVVVAAIRLEQAYAAYVHCCRRGPRVNPRPSSCRNRWPMIKLWWRGRVSRLLSPAFFDPDKTRSSALGSAAPHRRTGTLRLSYHAKLRTELG